VQSDAHIVRVGPELQDGLGAVGGRAGERGAQRRVRSAVQLTGLTPVVVGGGALQATVIDDKKLQPVLQFSAPERFRAERSVALSDTTYQFGRSALLGVEADINWADFKA